jgi:hypothetical protein
MAKARLHPFLNNLFGVIGKRDQTVGKTPGLGLTFGWWPGGTILGIKTKKADKVSILQAEQRARYTAADCSYKDLCPGHVTLLEEYMKEYNATHEDKFTDVYHFHMHLNMIARKTVCEPWSENFDGFDYTGGAVISWIDGFNGPDWGVNWVGKWFEGFNS